MKRLHTLVLAFSLLGVFALTSALPAQNPDNKKVVIVKKKVDENGEVTIEKIVSEGEDADAIIQSIGSEDEDARVVIRSRDIHVNQSSDQNENTNVSVNVDENDGHKVITIDVNGEVEVIELENGQELPEETRARLEEKGVYINDSGMLRMDKIDWHKDGDFDFDFDLNLEGVGQGIVHLGKGLAKLGDLNWNEHSFAIHSDINCAALGVYVSSNSPSGVFVSNTIGESGAEEAGVQRGDVITFIDEYPTTNYRELHEALALYKPGDVVAVTFERDGQEQRVEAQLRAWKEFPSFADRPHARVSCDAPEEVVSKKIIVIKKDKEDTPETDDPLFNQSPVDNTLQLQDFTAFPNPSDGKFRVQFAADAVPTVVSVFDASGKEIFRDRMENFSGYYNREMDLTNQARGGLVLSVEQDGKIFTEQIILN